MSACEKEKKLAAKKSKKYGTRSKRLKRSDRKYISGYTAGAAIAAGFVEGAGLLASISSLSKEKEIRKW